MDFEYRRTEEKDYEKLSLLFNEVFGKNIDSEFFKWKYRNGYSFIALQGEKIIGNYGGIFFNFIHKDRIYKIVQITDLMTHPEFRQRGILLKLGNLFYESCLKENIGFAYGFPGERSRIVGEKYLNYKPLSRIIFFCFNIKGEKGDFPLEKLNFLNYDLKNIILCTRKNGIYKDIDYFLWRYIENPLEDYLISYNDEAMFVFKISGREAILMDYFYKRKSKIKELFHHCQGSLKNSGVEILKTFPSPIFKDEKFEVIEEDYYLEYKILNVNPEKFLKLEDFLPSDYDVF